MVLHGHPWMLFERGTLIKMLKAHITELPTRLSLNKEVTSIKSEPDEVVVDCADGSSYTATMLIGADGINGTARSFVKNDSAIPADRDLDKDFTTTFYGVYGHGGFLSSNLEYGVAYETHSEGFSSQLIVPSKERYFFLIYQKLDKPTHSRQRITVEMEEELVRLHGKTYLAPGVTFQRIWENKTWNYSAPLEEGVAKKWFRDRVLLLGDAAHKMTPNIGFGVNTGWQSMVVLINILRPYLAEHTDPTTTDLTNLYAEFHRARRAQVKNDQQLSALATRLAVWDRLLWRFLDQYVLPLIDGDSLLAKHFTSRTVKKSVTLNWLSEPNFKEGLVKWDHKPVI
ncbi:hypothetical protein ACHAPJ_010237 [Fusarium lateritium]